MNGRPPSWWGYGFTHTREWAAPGVSVCGHVVDAGSHQGFPPHRRRRPPIGGLCAVRQFATRQLRLLGRRDALLRPHWKTKGKERLIFQQDAQQVGGKYFPVKPL